LAWVSNLSSDEAVNLFRESLALRRKLFGEKHGDVAQSLRGLARALGHQGKYAEAEPLYIHSLQIFEKDLDEINVKDAMENYILLLQKTNRAEEALKLENRLKTIQNRQKK